MRDYFEASIRQHVKRGEHLLGSLPKPVELPLEFIPLFQTCNIQLAGVLNELQALLDDRKMHLPEYQPERLRRFRRAVQYMMVLEATCIAALMRRHDDDAFLTQLTVQIAREVSYPLLPPVVTGLSQQYYHIYPNFNLLFVPLHEGTFLLHMPDLYHELAHPLIVENHNPRVRSFQNALWEALSVTLDYMSLEEQKEKRKRGPKQFPYYFRLWNQCWIEWAVEFFCDLFAIYTLGPAFAWSHIHLSAKGNQNPFHVPTLGSSSHPADHARMKAMLYGLQLIDFADAAIDIEWRWNELLNTAGAAAEPEYQRCFPDHLLELFAQKAYEGVLDLGVKIASSNTNAPISGVLNCAWQQFWGTPEKFIQWEDQAVTQLRNSIYKK